LHAGIDGGGINNSEFDASASDAIERYDRIHVLIQEDS
jgi:hypothetical protein